MSYIESKPVITVGGGGSGPISIEDELLMETPYVYGIVGVHDGGGGKNGQKIGGHSGEIRSILGTLPPGDATHRIAVRIRHPRIRQLFTHRWNIDGNNHMNGHRPSNELLAAAEWIEDRVHSRGIKLIEEAFKAHYIGRVIPVSDDNFHLRAILANGKHLDGEGLIDTRKDNRSPIVDFAFIPHPIKPDACPITPKPNPEAIQAILDSEGFVKTPSSEITSNRPTLRILKDVIKQSGVTVFDFYNAFTNWSETHQYTASMFGRNTCQELGFRPHYAFVNIPDHIIPPSYKDERSFVVPADIDNCQPYAEHVYGLPLTELLPIDGKLVVRHNGKVAAKLILGIIGGRRVEDILEDLNIPYVTPQNPRDISWQ